LKLLKNLFLVRLKPKKVFLVMKIIIANRDENQRDLIRRAGYAEFRDPNTRETSYVRRLRGDFYPRWHAYLKTEGQNLVINLHLDQKQPSYHGSHAHSGEYDGPTVEAEAQRIKSVLTPRA
jgi:hypothetical protein